MGVTVESRKPRSQRKEKEQAMPKVSAERKAEILKNIAGQKKRRSGARR